MERQQQWPTHVPKDTVLSCLRDYCDGSVWTPPPVCAVCAQHEYDCELVVISSGEPSALNLERLHIRDPFIIMKCVVQSLSTAFSFGSPLVDGLMLDKSGVFVDDCSVTRVSICSVCWVALSKPDCILRFALANNLYRGELPDRFLLQSSMPLFIFSSFLLVLRHEPHDAAATRLLFISSAYSMYYIMITTEPSLDDLFFLSLTWPYL
ncbi:hypothetical protein F4604DRAFT_1810884 [Suillus subluteus]|nr:hypothetical protein F4604DRAFT_1810884 [Suillus subluteus]